MTATIFFFFFAHVPSIELGLTPGDLLAGLLSQSEFSSRVDHIICADAKTEHLHNHFVCALIANLSRDLPDHGVASWVSANDKPLVVSKPASGDAAEQRLKTEVMQIPPRERRRLKAIPEVCYVWIMLNARV